MLPVLYSFRRCPYAMRARLAIACSGLKVELREILLRDKPAALLSASPKGTVPVLVREGSTVLEESLDIMLWAFEAGDDNGWFYSLDEETGKTVLALVDTCDKQFKPLLDRYKYPQRYFAGLSEDAVENRAMAARNEALLLLSQWDRWLKQSEYLLGDAPCLADLALFPFVRQFAHVDREGFKNAGLTQLSRWLTYWLEGPLFASVMKKYPVWREVVSDDESPESGIIFPEG